MTKRGPRPRGFNAIDLSGQRFGRLVVLDRSESDARGNAMWRCICDCGTERITMGKSLRQGGVQSCGCLSKERIKRKRRAHQSTAADEALLIQVTNKILRAEIRARKRKAA